MDPRSNAWVLRFGGGCGGCGCGGFGAPQIKDPNTNQVRWTCHQGEGSCWWFEKKPGCLGWTKVIILTSYMGIIRSHYTVRIPDKPTRIQWKVILGFFSWLIWGAASYESDGYYGIPTLLVLGYRRGAMIFFVWEILISFWSREDSDVLWCWWWWWWWYFMMIKKQYDYDQFKWWSIHMVIHDDDDDDDDDDQYGWWLIMLIIMINDHNQWWGWWWCLHVAVF